jgi:FkbM family methyltransferase
VLGRAKRAARKVVRELAALPLRKLAEEQRSQVVEDLLASMISEVEVRSHSLRFLTLTPLLLGRAQTALTKEPDTLRWIDQFRADDVLWDIGANVGVFSIYAAVMHGVRVLAFEPSADNYMVLCKNVEINALGERVTPYCVALSGNTGLGVLNSQSRMMGSALHQFGRPGDTSRYWPTKKGSHAQGMIGFSIDDFIRNFSPTFPNHLKVDVDGLELNILQGALETLRDSRVASVMVEFSITNEDERNSGMTLLSEAGFEFVGQGESQESAGVAAANYLFVRGQRLKGIGHP